MAQELDVYRDWLGIAETARPLSYYQLLRLPPFSDDVDKIRTHYRKMNAHVRKYATGEYAQQSQDLLNELAKAMLCLTDLQRKREYDASLGRKEEREGRPRTLEEILLANKSIDRDQLAKARQYADAVGLEIRDALVQQKLVTPEVAMQAYAESVGLPYIELEDIGVDEQLVPRIPPTIARQHSCVPVMIDANQLLMASPNPLAPEVEEDLRLRFEMPVRTVLCTASGVNAAIAEHYPRGAAAAAPPPKRPTRPVQSDQEDSVPPLSREEKAKRRKLVALVGFNITVILTVVVCSLITTLGIGQLLLAVVLGLLVAGGLLGGLVWLDR